MLLSIHGIHPIHVSTPHNAWTCRLHGIHPIHVSTPRNAGACLLCILTVSKLQLGHREARLRTMVFGSSAFSDLLPRIHTSQRRSLFTVYFNGFEAAAWAPWGTVANTRFLARRPFRICCHRPHVFVCAGSVAYRPATVQLLVLTTDLMFLSVEVRYLLRSTYLSWPV